MIGSEDWLVSIDYCGARVEPVTPRNRRNWRVEAEPLPVSMTATALRDSKGPRRGVVLVIEDLSELLAAQRAAAWSEVARRMAHEIKNPLTPIQLSAERIAKSYGRATANGRLARCVTKTCCGGDH